MTRAWIQILQWESLISMLHQCKSHWFLLMHALVGLGQAMTQVGLEETSTVPTV
jgi:hypothetical protein